MTRKQESMIATAVATLAERSDRFEKALSAIAERLAAPTNGKAAPKAEATAPIPAVTVTVTVVTHKEVKYLRVKAPGTKFFQHDLNPSICRALKAHGELIAKVAAQ